MSKVLIKLSCDKHDVCYTYGVHAMDKERWEKWKKLYSSMNDDNTDWWNYEQKEITDEEYNVLKELNLIGFGEDLPTAYSEKLDLYLNPIAECIIWCFWI